MYTATIRLRRAWLSDVVDPATDPLISGTVRSGDWSEAQDGEIRQYAGGRRQGVTYPSVLRTEAVTFVGLSYAQLRLVRERRGSTMLFRSSAGERFFCCYFSYTTKNTESGTTLNDGRGFDVTLALYEVDFDESVDPGIETP